MINSDNVIRIIPTFSECDWHFQDTSLRSCKSILLFAEHYQTIIISHKTSFPLLQFDILLYFIGLRSNAMSKRKADEKEEEEEEESFKLLQKKMKIPRVTTDPEFSKKVFNGEDLREMEDAENMFVSRVRVVNDSPIWKEFYQRLEAATKTNKQDLLDRDQMIETLKKELGEGKPDGQLIKENSPVPVMSSDEKFSKMKELRIHWNQKATEEILSANESLKFNYEEWIEQVEDGEIQLATAIKHLEKLSVDTMELLEILRDLQDREKKFLE